MSWKQGWYICQTSLSWSLRRIFIQGEHLTTGSDGTSSNSGEPSFREVDESSLNNAEELEKNDAEQEVPNAEHDEEDDDEEEEIMHEEKKVELKNNYKYLLDTLFSASPKMVEQVKLFVSEMRRITLLREELWYGTLNQISSDLDKRMEQLDLELVKLKANQSLSSNQKNDIAKEKYEILLQPIVSILEHVNEITTKLDAETPNEELFQVNLAKDWIMAKWGFDFN